MAELATLPTILEVKERLDGSTAEYRCERLDLTATTAVLLYRLPPGATFLGLDLPPGSVSLGYYWADRPYNLYHWLRPDGSTAAWYWNIADRTRLSPERVAWRDLIVDVLVLPGQPPRELDRDELPPNLDAALVRAIDEAVAALLGQLPHLEAEIAARSAAYLAALAGR